MEPSSKQRQAEIRRTRIATITAASFRPVAAGFLYRAPNPRIFGRVAHYIVSTEQRDEIVEALVPRSGATTPSSRLARVLTISFVALVAVLLVASFLLLFASQFPRLAAPGEIAAMTLLPLAATTLVSLHLLSKLQLAKLQPILEHAQRTDARITNDDVLWGAKTGDPIKSARRWAGSAILYAIVSAVFTAFAVVSWHPGEGFLPSVQSIFIISAACLFAFQAACDAYCALCQNTPPVARTIGTIVKRTLSYGALGYIAIALGYASLLATGFVGPDLAAARVRYQRLALEGNIEDMSRLAGQLRDGRGGPKDYVKSRQWYEQAAAARDASAMFWVGWFHFKGVGVAQDYATARAWFEKAAARGDGAAMALLGASAHFGLGTAKDYGQARDWYEKAAAVGNSSGMNGLGEMFKNGLGVVQDYGKAREWYERAATAGLGASMNALGTIYVNGWGVARDTGTAKTWYEKAAAAGHLEGMQHLAVMLDKGGAEDVDPARAAHLLLQSSKLGHVWSKTMLSGSMLLFSPATRVELKRELARAGRFRGTVDATWNDEARDAVAEYLKPAL